MFSHAPKPGELESRNLWRKRAIPAQTADACLNLQEPRPCDDEFEVLNSSHDARHHDGGLCMINFDDVRIVGRKPGGSYLSGLAANSPVQRHRNVVNRVLAWAGLKC